ncbi:MAG: tRNA 5-methoxyuridine(34)/uridine 5-oxyacetic acid(34) synthase CmoB [Psittacicella sp.]
MNFNSIYTQLIENSLSVWLKPTSEELDHFVKANTFYINKFLKQYNKLKIYENNEIDLINKVSILNNSVNKNDIPRIESIFKKFTPWKKGPFDILNIKIDSEWRSDFKWNRITKEVSFNHYDKILDVGCGNGYHMLRMLGSGAKSVIGVDPSQLSYFQFQLVKKFLTGTKYYDNINILPFGFEVLPKTSSFDKVFSMGVLYHRKSPIEHLLSLRNQLNDNGTLILETIVISGDENTFLIPDDTYAKMYNVYFIPSVKSTIKLLKKAKFMNIKCINIETTSIEEQRTTSWCAEESLKDFLNDDKTLTVEGYEAPKRAIFIANKQI